MGRPDAELSTTDPRYGPRGCGPDTACPRESSAEAAGPATTASHPRRRCAPRPTLIRRPGQRDVVAVASRNPDSLVCHLARVSHRVQNRTVAPFATSLPGPGRVPVAGRVRPRPPLPPVPDGYRSAIRGDDHLEIAGIRCGGVEAPAPSMAREAGADVSIVSNSIYVPAPRGGDVREGCRRCRGRFHRGEHRSTRQSSERNTPMPPGPACLESRSSADGPPRQYRCPPAHRYRQRLVSGAITQSQLDFPSN